MDSLQPQNENRFAGNFPVIIQFSKLYILILFIFTLFRLILFFNEFDRINSSVEFKNIILAFLMGLRFDLVICGYILILPFFVLSIISFFKRPLKIVYHLIFWLILGLSTIAFFIGTIDIPYFNHTFSRLSITALEWMDSPEFVAKMIIEEPKLWLFFIPAIVILLFYYRYLKRILFIGSRIRQKLSYLTIIASILFLGIMFLGIRGRIEKKSPIRIGTAYFSNNAFLNQLGLNANFTFIKSYLSSQKAENRVVQIMDDQLALGKIQSYLDFETSNEEMPLLRSMPSDTARLSLRYNVVIVMMESMSAAKLKKHGNQDHLTPYFDSLIQKGYYFENAYSSGIHTFNGIYSTLFGYPSLFRQHPMKGTTMLKYHSIFSELKKHDYQSIYFTTHDGQFDNVEGFLKANECDEVVSKRTYPSEKVKTTLGVPDDYMFRYSIPILNKMHESNKPFLAAMMTTSDHVPYYIPDYFKPKSSGKKKQIVEYADYALRIFMQEASKQQWYDSTLFVFVADHGVPIDGTYELSLDYNHVPLLFYAPNMIPEPQSFTRMANQFDIFPSIMSLLNLSWENNTFGTDLFSFKRPYTFFNVDDKYGVIDQEWLLIVKQDGSKALYKYQEKNLTNFIDDMPSKANEMLDYAQTHLQACQYVIKNGKQ